MSCMIVFIEHVKQGLIEVSRKELDSTLGHLV